MDDTGRQTGARRGQQPRRNGAPRPGQFPVSKQPAPGRPEGGDGFEQGWFSPQEPPAPGPADGQPNGQRSGQGRAGQSSAHLPPVPRPTPQPRQPPTPAGPDADFDRERFENAFTDPGPFGRVPFESRPAMEPVPRPAGDRDDDEREHQSA